MTATYLDTSALMRLSEGLVAGQSARNDRLRSLVLGILGDRARRIACSELTIIEVHNNLTVNWRKSDAPYFDEAWWLSACDEVFDLLDGTVEVLPIHGRAVEQVMALVTIATRDNLAGGAQRALKAWDALHVVIASRWAHDIDQDVELVTADEDFSTALTIPGMSERLSVLQLDVAGTTGMGAHKTP